MVVALLLLACRTDTDVGPAGDPGNDPEGADTGSPYVVDDDPIEPTWTLDEVGAAIEQAVDSLALVRAQSIFEAYESLLASRTSTCPYTNPDYAELYGVDYWYDTCAVPDGTSYAGFGYGYVNRAVDQGQYVYDLSAYLYADLAITRADGSTFAAGGTASQTLYRDVWYGYAVNGYSLAGEFAWDAPEAAGTWLAQGLSVSLYVQAVEYPTYPATSLYVDGGVSRLDGVTDTVEFIALYAESTALGTPCASEPGGAVRVRDERGDWYEVYFQGPLNGTDTAFPPECDGCGEVWFRGERLGLTCPDLSGLYAFGASRW